MSAATSSARSVSSWAALNADVQAIVTKCPSHVLQNLGVGRAFQKWEMLLMDSWAEPTPLIQHLRPCWIMSILWKDKLRPRNTGTCVRSAYWLPAAVLTNYRKLGSLKYQKLVLSQFWRPKV